MSNIYQVLLALAAIIFLTGCSTPKIAMDFSIPGELKLNGVSKIAIVDFNSLPDDPQIGCYKANEATTKLAQDMVAEAMFQSRLYDVASIDAEQLIKSNHPNALLKQRFDGVIYGRVWWQVTPEVTGTYPQVFDLGKWRTVKYRKKVGKKYKEFKKKVQTSREDKVALIPYRAWNVNLMLSISIYRLSSNGQLQKITEIYDTAEQCYVICNGEFEKSFQILTPQQKSRFDVLVAAHSDSKKEEQHDVTGMSKITQNTKTIPTDLEGQMTLGKALTNALVSKVASSRKTLDVEIHFKDNKLENLLKNSAFIAARRYIINYVLTDGYEPAIERFGDLEFDKACEVMVKAAPEAGLDPQSIIDAKNEYIDDKIEFLYAMGLCEEAMGNYEKALYTYRFVFNHDPIKRYALGISRCALAMGLKSKLQERQDERDEAKDKAKLR